jgi:NAD-dependent dihydropyrimidine dehydrogenase PreA subunit
VTFVITDECIKAQQCVGVCPVDCIYDAGDHFIINPAECIDCTMCDPVYPVDAIRPTSSSPRRWTTSRPRPPSSTTRGWSPAS